MTYGKVYFLSSRLRPSTFLISFRILWSNRTVKTITYVSEPDIPVVTVSDSEDEVTVVEPDVVEVEDMQVSNNDENGAQHLPFRKRRLSLLDHDPLYIKKQKHQWIKVTGNIMRVNYLFFPENMTADFVCLLKDGLKA